MSHASPPPFVAPVLPLGPAPQHAPDASPLDLAGEPIHTRTRWAFQRAALLELWPRGVRVDGRPLDLDDFAARQVFLDPLALTLGVPTRWPMFSSRVLHIRADGWGRLRPRLQTAPLPRWWRRRLRRPVLPPLRRARVTVTPDALSVEPGPQLRPLTPATVALAGAALGIDPLALALGLPIPSDWQLPSTEAGHLFLRAVTTNARRFGSGPASEGDAFGAVVGLTLAAVRRASPHVTARLGGIALASLATAPAVADLDAGARVTAAALAHPAPPSDAA